MRRLALFVALTLALVVAACTPKPKGPIRFALDHTLTPAEVAEIKWAADKWNNLPTLPSHHISIDPRGEWRIDEVDQVPGGWNGMFQPAERLIIFDDNVRGTTLALVALHELGHALGLGHTTNGVMQDGPSMIAQHKSPPSEFSAEDIAECRRAGACP